MVGRMLPVSFSFWHSCPFAASMKSQHPSHKLFPIISTRVGFCCCHQRSHHSSGQLQKCSFRPQHRCWNFYSALCRKQKFICLYFHSFLPLLQMVMNGMNPFYLYIIIHSHNPVFPYFQ